MVSLVIHDLDDDVKARLRVQAAEHGRSMEAEVRAILAAAVLTRRPPTGLGSFIHAVERLLGQTFAHLVLPFDVDCTAAYALIVSTGTAIHRPVSTAGAQIAAICTTHAAALATRNTKDFVGFDIAVVNPWIG